MKAIVTIPFLVAHFVACGQGVILGPGQSVGFQFASLPYAGPASNNGSSFSIDFALGSFMDNERISLELFPNTFADSPYSGTYSGTANPNAYYGITVVWPKDDPLYWPDLQGAVRVTMLAGSATITEFRVRQVVGENFYFQTFNVPEPSVICLLGLGGLAFLRLRVTSKVSFDRLSEAKARQLPCDLESSQRLR